MKHLILAGLCGFAPIAASADMTLVGVYEWTSDRPYFGGFSGLELSEDGMSFTVISDSGFIGTGTLTRENGAIIDAAHDPFYLMPEPLLWPGSGEPTRDSEGLAVTSDGTVYVSYEGIAVIREERGREESPVVLPASPEWGHLQSNGSLEALAVDADDRLYVVPERSGRALRPFPVYRFDGEHWEVVFHFPRIGQLVPTGADIGPDGRIYLLERDFNGWAFTSRIRRFDMDGTGEILWQSRPGDFDNLEGISVWQDASGMRITMISDDNYRSTQVTQFVEFRLTE